MIPVRRAFIEEERERRSRNRRGRRSGRVLYPIRLERVVDDSYPREQDEELRCFRSFEVRRLPISDGGVPGDKNTSDSL